MDTSFSLSPATKGATGPTPELGSWFSCTTDPGQAGYLAGEQAGPAHGVSRPAGLWWECWSSPATERKHKCISTNISLYSDTVFSLFDRRSCSSSFCAISLEGQWQVVSLRNSSVLAGVTGTSAHTWLCDPGAWQQCRCSLHTGRNCRKHFGIGPMKAWAIAWK